MQLEGLGAAAGWGLNAQMRLRSGTPHANGRGGYNFPSAEAPRT